MDVHKRRTYLRPAVLIVVLLVHGSLILILLRSKAPHRARPESELLSEVFFILPKRRPTILAPEIVLTSPRAPEDLALHLLPDASIPSAASPLDTGTAAASQSVDWLSEAHGTAADIAGRGKQDGEKLPMPPESGNAPWDAHAHLLEATGHGLKLRIPVQIPLNLIDHCFTDIDLGQTPYGPEERLQLGCALRKQPPRGDLFDFLHKQQPR